MGFGALLRTEILRGTSVKRQWAVGTGLTEVTTGNPCDLFILEHVFGPSERIFASKRPARFTGRRANPPAVY
jgi:hypothetical protein